MLMSSSDYRGSLRRFRPTVFVNGRRLDSVADDAALAPGLSAIGLTYDFAREPQHAPLMLATQASSGRTVNRLLRINATTTDLLYKLEAVRLLCRHSGCAQRYLTHDALNAIGRRPIASTPTRARTTMTASSPTCMRCRTLTLGVAMTDAKGDRSKRPHEQAAPDTYVRIVERRADGIVIRGTKAIVTGAPYVHGFLVMPGRSMDEADADFAVCCAVPLDAAGITIVARPAGRPGQNGARFSGRYGQSTGVVLFDDVFVPHERVFLAGEWAHAGFLATTYATHHRHSCIGARAGFGDLLIGAGVLVSEANGLDPGQHSHIRDAMVELIKIVEGFFACGVAASVYGFKDGSGNIQPAPSSMSLAGWWWRCPGPTRTTIRQRRPASTPCWRGGRTFRRRNASKWRACWRI